MITKTYLDGKLNQLEEKIKRIIDVKDERQTEKLTAEIGELKNNLKALEEKVAENRDILDNYLQKRNGVVDDNLEEDKEAVEDAEDKSRNSNNDDDVITSDI